MRTCQQPDCCQGDQRRLQVPEPSLVIMLNCGVGLREQAVQRVLPLREVARQRQPDQLPVDLTVLADEEVAIRDRQGPVDAGGGRKSSLESRFAASPSFIMSESPASCSRSSPRQASLPRSTSSSTRSTHARRCSSSLAALRPSEQHGLSADVFVELRLEAPVIDEVDPASEDLLQHLLEPEEAE